MLVACLHGGLLRTATAVAAALCWDTFWAVQAGFGS
jgi:hypothetical protein